MDDAPSPEDSVLVSETEGYGWQSYEDFRDTVREYADTEPNGYFGKIDEDTAHRIAAKLAHIVRPWVKATQPMGSWEDMTRTMRLIVLNDITGLKLSSTKDLPAGYSHLAGMLGARTWRPDTTVADIIRDKFGF
jgi:hypothetical protein